MDLGQTMHLSERDFWKDNKEDIVYGRINHVLNEGRGEDILGVLKREKPNPHTGDFIELMIHEQYFYPDYKDFLPDYKRRVLTAVKWAVDNGYQPAWVQDCVLER